MRKEFLDYNSLINDLSEMIETETGISEISFRLDLRLLKGSLSALEELKKRVADQKEPLSRHQLYDIKDDLLDQLYYLYKMKTIKKSEGYPFSIMIWENFMNRDDVNCGNFRYLEHSKTEANGKKHYHLEDVNLS